MSMLTLAIQIAQPWADAYADSKLLETTVTFAHFAGLLVGGGFAIATDRATLHATWRGAPRDATTGSRILAEIHTIHRPVLIGLAVTTLTGLLLLAADLERLATSASFWTKMGLFALLLANGLRMTFTERALRDDPAAERPWRRLRRSALASVALWLAVTLAGVWLTNAA